MEKDYTKGKNDYGMKMINHPSKYLSPDIVQEIRDFSSESEYLKQLHPVQLEIIQKQKWLRLFVPELYDGLELSLPDALHMEEAIAWADGSVGWTVTLCAGAGWFIGFLEQEMATAVFSNPSVCLAGSGKTTGVAKIISEGYEITGYWDYATGAVLATAFTANCVMEENGVLLKNKDGSDWVQSFLFFRDEVTIHQTWNSMGMIATGSHSFEVKALVLKRNRCFVIDSRHAALPNPVYQFPFLQFAETTLAVNSSGMAIRFLELCKIWFRSGATKAMVSLLENSQEQLDRVRQEFYNVAYRSWEACLSDCNLTPSLLESITRSSRKLALTARKVTDELYPCCGLRAADPGTEINRVWRNLHTASQHSLLNSYRKS